MKLSIVLPCYNEGKNIPNILDRFSKVLSGIDIEVILVNNGSQDDSEQVLKRLLPQYPFARSVTVEVNQGYGFGILSGLAAAKGEYLAWTHADMQTDPYDVIKSLEVIERMGAPRDVYVKGRRKGRPFFDTFFTVGMSIFESLLMATPLWDINGQPNVFHRSLYEQWDEPPHDFSLDLYAYYMAKRNNIRMKRFTVLFPEREHGISSWNAGFSDRWKLIKRTMGYSIKLRKRLNRS